MKQEKIKTLAAEHADVVIGCFGLNPDMEGEEGDASNADAGGDKKSIALPQIQQDLIKALAATGTPMVLVNISGSAVAIPEEHASAVVQRFYPGEFGGAALADVLFGVGLHSRALAGADHAHEVRRRAPRTLVADEEPVLAPQRNRPDGVLRRVVVNARLGDRPRGGSADPRCCWRS
jgi:hypothetical protein